jgi:hypothetical protein
MAYPAPVWKSGSDAHGRSVVVTQTTGCDVCGSESVRAIEIDASDGEYLPLRICGECAHRLADEGYLT